MKRFPPKRVLVAADLSGPSLSALELAKALATRWGSALEIVHIDQPLVPGAVVAPGGLPAPFPPFPAESPRSIERKLRAAAAGFPPERLRLRTVRGWPPQALLELARPERADMMIMGAHGYAGLDRLLTGSVSEAVIRRAHIPVLAVPERLRVGGGLARILAPWNGRPYATRALRWARELARGLGASLDVLYVEEPGRAVQANWAELDKRLIAILGSSLDWTLRSRRGPARERIVAEADSGRYDLTVVSAHRRPFGADFALGSTVERLLRHSRTPVLAVPSGKPGSRIVRRLVSRAGGRLY